MSQFVRVICAEARSVPYLLNAGVMERYAGVADEFEGVVSEGDRISMIKLRISTPFVPPTPTRAAHVNASLARYLNPYLSVQGCTEHGSEPISWERLMEFSSLENWGYGAYIHGAAHLVINKLRAWQELANKPLKPTMERVLLDPEQEMGESVYTVFFSADAENRIGTLGQVLARLVGYLIANYQNHPVARAFHEKDLRDMVEGADSPDTSSYPWALLDNPNPDVTDEFVESLGEGI